MLVTRLFWWPLASIVWTKKLDISEKAFYFWVNYSFKNQPTFYLAVSFVQTEKKQQQQKSHTTFRDS